MRVEELIEQLKQYPPHLHVAIEIVCRVMHDEIEVRTDNDESEFLKPVQETGLADSLRYGVKLVV